MDRQSIKRFVFRALALLLGAALGIALFLLFPSELTAPVERVAGTLPAELRAMVFGDSQAAADDDQLTASGVIQAEQVAIASEFGGRITEIPWDAGETVAAGELLIRLDTSVLDTEIAAAEALVTVAEAGLAQAEAGVRTGQIEVAQVQLAQAQAARNAATQVLSDTMGLVENPQEIWLQIAVAAAQAEAAGHRVAQAEALRDAAGIAKDKFETVRSKEGRHSVEVASGSVDDLPSKVPPEIVDEVANLADGSYSYGNWELTLSGGSYQLVTHRNVSLPLEFHLTPNLWWQAWVGVNAAVAELEGVQSSLYHLYLQQDAPQLLEAQVDEAVNALAQAEAQVSLAQAQLDGMLAGAADEQTAVLEARLDQARSAVESLETLRSMMELRSPLDGSVVSISAYPGEVAAPGATLLLVADLASLSTLVYVPENQIGQVALDGEVVVTVDSFPGRAFAGTVSRIADQAEFTPRNVATREERVHLVFAVEIQLENEAGLLKPGMPVDVRFALVKDQDRPLDDGLGIEPIH